jgi:hypothetical protein
MFLWVVGCGGGVGEQPAPPVTLVAGSGLAEMRATASDPTISLCTFFFLMQSYALEYVFCVCSC